MGYTQLKEKGWTIAEITKLRQASAHSEHYDRHFSKIVFWSALVVIVFANLVVSLILIPVLLVLQKFFLYALMLLLGGMIGFLYNFLIRDIGHLERKHHLWAGLLVPLLAAANMLLVVAVSNRAIAALGVQNPLHNAWLLAGLFALAFIVPAVVGKIKAAVGGREAVGV